MTSIETKMKMNEEFKGIKYILTSSMRSKLLLSIYEKSKNLDELRNELDKPSATILHGLKELESSNLVKKYNKNYSLTSNGFLLTANMIKLIENWKSINKSKMFWNTHDLKGIPDKLLKNIYLLKNANYEYATTNDLSNAFNTYVKLIKKAKKLKIILPIYSENHFKHFMQILNGDTLEHLELVISENILNSMKKNDLLNEMIIKNDKVSIKSISMDIKIFLTYNDEFMSLTLYFNDGHYDDSQILISKDKDCLKWASLLSSYY